jgi:hypothetical protein
MWQSASPAAHGHISKGARQAVEDSIMRWTGRWTWKCCVDPQDGMTAPASQSDPQTFNFQKENDVKLLFRSGAMTILLCRPILELLQV